MSTTVSVNINNLIIQPRRMLDWGPERPGYCGETSVQMALLLNKGCYMSSEIVHRAINCEELLIGSGNDTRAGEVVGLDDYDIYESISRKMNLKQNAKLASSNLSFPEQQEYNFIQEFVPKHIDQGHLIIAGFFCMHEHGEGDDEYDHIMPIVEYRYRMTENGKKIVDRIGYLDLWLTGEVRYLDAKDGSLKLRSREDAWLSSSKNKNKNKKHACLEHPLPWFIPLESIHAIAFTNKNNYASSGAAGSAAIIPLSVQVPYSMEVDCRRLFTSWYKNGRHPWEDQLSISMPSTKKKQAMFRDFKEWLEYEEGRCPGQFSQVLRASDAPTRIPIKLFINEQFLRSTAATAAAVASSDFVILKLQGILAMRIFEEIVSSTPKKKGGYADDGLCNVSVVHRSTSDSDDQQPFRHLQLEVLCTEVAYFVGVESKFFESTLMKNDRFLKMMKNYEEMIIKNKTSGNDTTLPISLPAGYMGVDISAGEDNDDEEDEEEEDDDNDDA